jgi:hypothetical protein
MARDDEIHHRFGNIIVPVLPQVEEKRVKVRVVRKGK